MKKPSTPALNDIAAHPQVRWGLSYGVLPLTIMILVVIISLIGYSLSTANLESAKNQTIDHILQQSSSRITGTFNSYAHLSWGSTGRVQSGGAGAGIVDEDTWQHFISVYNLEQNFSGMEAIGVSFGPSPSDNTITYVSPKNDVTSRTVGNNMGTSPLLRSAMENSARTGQTTLSDLFQTQVSTRQSLKSKKPGFLMYTPIYDQSMLQATQDEKLQALKGYTVALFLGDQFFKGQFNDLDLNHTNVKVYMDNTKSQNLLYQVGHATDADDRVVSQHLDEYGRRLTVIYSFDNDNILPWSTTYFPKFLLFGGMFTGLLFAGVAGYMLRNRYYRLTYEKERDVEFAKDELLSLASHQLRTPATGVKQYLGMVLQGFAGDVTTKQREYLERAYASNNRQLGVINDILHLAKLETGRIVLSERKFDLAKMVRDVVDEQQEDAGKAQVKLLLEAPSKGSMIGDSHMLRMVVENLVSNGIKYTPPGGMVSVKMLRRANRWVIMVKDTGVGIAKSDFSKLFKQFTRINNPRTEFVTGTGVGLYLSYHLTVLHGGSISVTSRKSKGSTFTVRLPRKI